MRKFQKILNYLNRNNVQYTVVSHPDAYSAHQVALASHVPDHMVAKTLVVKAGGQYWMAVLGADHRLDVKLLRDALEQSHVHLATEEEAADLFPDCEAGAMPPLGSMYDLPVIVDKALTEDAEILFNACTHRDAIRLRYADFERLENPIVAPITEEEPDRVEL